MDPAGLNQILSAVVTLLVLGTLMLLGAMMARSRRGIRPVLALVGVALVALGIGSAYVDDVMLWGWVMATIPPLLVAHHAIYLVWIKPRFLPDDFTDESKYPAGGNARLLAEAVRASNKYFSASNIVLRLGVPALALLLVGLTIVSILHPDSAFLKKMPRSFWGKDTLLEAVRFGAAGAYVYVLTYLGSRSFRHDISSGAALWCTVTLIVGPILAGVVSLVWKPDGTTGPNWAQQLVYFFSGVAPRTMMQMLTESGRRLLEGQSKVAQLPMRSLPPGYIGGITPEVEERLREEGISDVYALSMADPHRLLRNTPFNKKEILDWIDQAMLIRSLPAHWEELMEAGVSGAMDLAWYIKSEKEIPPNEMPNLEALAAEVGIRPELLRDIARRLAEDSQVQMIRALYQFETSEVGEALSREEAKDQSPVAEPRPSLSLPPPNNTPNVSG
jgi:hypothetical protein